MSKHSTTGELADRYRQQINAEFNKTKRQTTNQSLQDRRKRLRHLSKLSRKVHDRGYIVLKIEGLV